MHVAEEHCPFNLAPETNLQGMLASPKPKIAAPFCKVQQSGNVLNLLGFIAAIIKHSKYPYLFMHGEEIECPQKIDRNTV